MEAKEPQTTAKEADTWLNKWNMTVTGILQGELIESIISKNSHILKQGYRSYRKTYTKTMSHNQLLTFCSSTYCILINKDPFF